VHGSSWNGKLPAHHLKLSATHKPFLLPQLCPLNHIARLAWVPRLGYAGLTNDARIEKAASNPVNLGSALALLAADNTTAAARLQKRVCNVLLYPQDACNLTGTASGDALGPLHHRLEASSQSGPAAAAQWVARTAVLVGLSPLGAGFGAMPDALCQVPPAKLAKIPLQIRWQLVSHWVGLVSAGSGVIVFSFSSHGTWTRDHWRRRGADLSGAQRGHMPVCWHVASGSGSALLTDPSTSPKHPAAPAPQCPYDVALVPIVTQLSMGRVRSGVLHARLCDLLKRPSEACETGRYHVSRRPQRACLTELDGDVNGF
jgi:hypothetical protein